jgi:hypothetical protein
LNVICEIPPNNSTKSAKMSHITIIHEKNVHRLISPSLEL